MPKTILFDQTHDEISRIDDPRDEGISVFAGMLAKEGYDTGKIGLPENFSARVLRKADLLCIFYPGRAFLAREVDAVLSFVREGGGLLLSGEWGNLRGNAVTLNAISGHYGIHFNEDRITDTRNIYEEDVKVLDQVVGRRKEPQVARITQFARHPVTKGLKEVIHISGCSLRAPQECILAWSDEFAFGDLDADSELDPGEAVGSLATAAHPNTNAGGRMVCLGDTSILTNKYIARLDNRKFLVNVVRWLVKDL